MINDDKLPLAIPSEELKRLAAAVAEELRAVGTSAGSEFATATGGGSLHRQLPRELQSRFIDVRAALYQRGIYDPVLVRFDSATAPSASTLEIAEQLAAIAEAL